MWRNAGDSWTRVGSFTGSAASIAAVGDRLVVAGVRNDSGRGATPTIWSSSDGTSWSVAHEEPTSSVSRFNDLVPDGELLVAVGYSGPGELDVHGLLLTSSDGEGWTTGPAVEPSEEPCPPTTSGSACPAVSSYPHTGAVVGDGLYLATAEQVTTTTGDTTRGVTRIRTGIYRSSPEPASGPVAEADGSTELKLPPTIAAGAIIEGELVIDNTTGQTIELTGCGSPFTVVLESADGSIRQNIGSLACLSYHTVPVGRSSWSVTVFGTDGNACAGGSTTPGLPACGPDGRPPPLPPGLYTATVEMPSSLPAAPPVEIVVE